MKSILTLITALCAVSLVNVTASAASAAASTVPISAATAAGTWTFVELGRSGSSTTEHTLKLEHTDGKLSGVLIRGETVLAPNPKSETASIRPLPAPPPAQITDASFQDGVLTFNVSRDVNGQVKTWKYSGKLTANKIKGSSEIPGPKGAPIKRAWVATRAK